MDSFNSVFWIGLALAIPLSIVGNLLTPKIQSLLATLSESAAKKRLIITEHEKARIASYIEKPQRLYVYLLTAIVSAIFLGSITSVFSVLFFVASSLAAHPAVWYAAAQFLFIFGGLLVVKICFDAINTIGKVKASGG